MDDRTINALAGGEPDPVGTERCKFELVDRARDAHGTKADWFCVTHDMRADSERERECERKRHERTTTR